MFGFLVIQKLLITDRKDFGNSFQLNIRDEPFAAFDTLHSVFIQIQPRHLQHVGQFSLGRFFRQVLSNFFDSDSANIINAAVGFILIHRCTSLFNIY